MPALDKLLTEVAQLDRKDREQLLLTLLFDLKPGQLTAATLEGLGHPSVVATPGVCGGAARLIRTRIPVWSLERMRQLGVPEAEILKSYPTLEASDLLQAWIYAEHHRQEIEDAIAANEPA